MARAPAANEEVRCDLARLKRARRAVATAAVQMPGDVERAVVNPTLELIRLSWKLTSILEAEGSPKSCVPARGDEWALVWRDPVTSEVRVDSATPDELLVLKVLVEDIDIDDAASEGGVTPGVVYAAMRRSARKGLVIMPRSRIRRDVSRFPEGERTDESFVTADTFTLQWHVTHACDLNCKHCYDRSKISPLKLDEGVRVLDDLVSFCISRNVRGHVCFSGGNPLLHPDFFEIYEAAAKRGFSTSILGNPAPREAIERIVDIQRPGYFQVSLEGLPDHNDGMRGRGNFMRVILFLGVLRDLDISQAVMLTLTKDNIDQVLPLAEMLRGHTEHFTFNRLSPVGSGAALVLPSREEYASFLKAYVDAAKDNPVMGFKDNLINVELLRRGVEPFDGCTGFGCGAAFNFLAILPDGEAHACRKFPSPLGNILKEGLAPVYDSSLAQRYREGSNACTGCSLRPACGGCLSITHGCGHDVFEDRDPHCFLA